MCAYFFSLCSILRKSVELYIENCHLLRFHHWLHSELNCSLPWALTTHCQKLIPNLVSYKWLQFEPFYTVLWMLCLFLKGMSDIYIGDIGTWLVDYSPSWISCQGWSLREILFSLAFCSFTVTYRKGCCNKLQASM